MHGWGAVTAVSLEVGSADGLQPARYHGADRLLAQVHVHAHCQGEMTTTYGADSLPEEERFVDVLFPQRVKSLSGTSCPVSCNSMTL